MRIHRALASSLASFALAAGAAAMPQPASASNDGLPDGSWRQSCERAYVQDGKLHAVCQRDGGKYQSTSAQIGSCQAFGNRSGTLFCESSGDGSGTSGQWSGSFRNSCRDISVGKHGNLNATCRKNNGTYQHSNLQAEKCRTYRAGNRDGKLFCESGDGGSQNISRWDGSFSRSCRDMSVDSNGTLTATCQTSNGTWNRSSLSMRQCNSHQAGNREGNLFCESADGGSENISRWDGSFSRSCRDMSVDSNGTLTATCQTMSGSWNRSSLSMRQCDSHQAGNRDGTLFCER